MRTDPQGRTTGFTLLELMVALAVFAIAALALIRLEGLSLGQTAELDARLLREVTAQNLATELRTDPQPPPSGTAQGTATNGGRRFAWTRTVARRGVGDLLTVTLVVRADDGGAATTLMFLRAGGGP